MVKLIYCLRRLPHLSREEFQRYWREHHGPLVVSVKDVNKIRRYVQSHTIWDERQEAQRVALGRPEPFDGVAELWWDSAEEFTPQNRTPERQQAGTLLQTDEMKFIDLPRSPLWLAEEYPVITDIPNAGESAKPDKRVKIVYCGRGLPGQDRSQMQSYWRNNHAPLVKSFAGVLSIRRYVQSHTKYDEINERMRAPQNRPPAFDGVAELWWDSIEERLPVNPDPERIKAGQVLFEDEKKFVDHAQSPNFLTREWVFIDR
ncbi:MAG: EthD domain-containing protein [Dehalococcoidia bacterium]|nr:EthD domain-containing protein [Dehalococcoidia bacterium]